MLNSQMVVLIFSLYSFNESIAKWQQLDKPIRAAMLDVHDECGYILQTQHFSKFAVGGIIGTMIE